METVNHFLILSTPEPPYLMKSDRSYERETSCHDCNVQKVANLSEVYIFRLEYAAGGFRHIFLQNSLHGVLKLLDMVLHKLFFLDEILR